MSLKTRRIIFIFFVLAFLIISTFAISYASGYKLTFKKKIIEKTGMLILDTKPRGAKIYLNGEPQQLFLKKYFDEKNSYITTPAKIKNLAPGKYEVKMELSGYSSWQKKLEVTGGVSTFAEDVYLFKNNLPVILAEGKISQISLSPNNEYLAVAREKEAYLIELRTENKIPLYGEKNSPLMLNASSSFPVLWSPASAKILIDHLIFQAGNGEESLDLNEFVKQKSSNFRWSGSEDEVLFLGEDKKNSSIYSLNLISKKVKKIIDEEKIINFFVKNSYLFIVNQAGKKINLNIYEINSGQKIGSAESLPVSDYEFINTKHKLVNLYDKKHGILYLINPFSPLPLKETINNVKYTYWINENKLLYANDFEIWLSDFNSAWAGQKKLLTRISEPITGIIWHPSNNYLIYSTLETINSIELDEREKRNSTELIKLDKISEIFINKKGEILYFSAKLGSREGLYKLTIQ